MVVQGLIALALAGPTGGLFGLAYGTAIRVGYEIIYPLLFTDIAKNALPKESAVGRASFQATSSTNVPSQIAEVLKGLTQMYSTVGGLEANAFGINTGVKNAMKQIQDDPELVELLKKNSKLLGQNITVNLSGTGLINSQGQVVSDVPELELDSIEEIEVGLAVEAHQQKAADAACRAEYGAAFSVAGFDSSGKHVSCQKIVGGHITSRRTWPPLTQTSTPEQDRIDEARRNKEAFEREEKLKQGLARDKQYKAIGITAQARQAFFKWFNTQKRMRKLTGTSRQSWQARMIAIKRNAIRSGVNWGHYSSWFRIGLGQL